MGKYWNAALSELSNARKLVPTPDYLAAATIQSSSVLTGPSTIDGDLGRNLGVESRDAARSETKTRKKAVEPEAGQELGLYTDMQDTDWLKCTRI